MNLASDIAFLLYQHNCVIVPGFGAFLVNEKKAERNTIANFANPKSKAISFNAQIQSNDGLLANYLRNKYSYSFEQGLSTIKTFVDELNEKLQSKRNAEVSEIGTFYLTKEEKLIFVPYHSVNFDIASFGLPKVRLKLVQRSPVVALPETKENEKVEIIKPPVSVKPPSKSIQKIELQEKKRSVLLEQSIPVDGKKQNSLVWINSLGTILILTMLAGILYFELSNKPTADKSYANLIDTPSNVSINQPVDSIPSIVPIEKESATKAISETKQVPAKVEQPGKNKIEAKKLKLFAVCTEPMADTLSAEKLKVELMHQFSGAFVWKENNNYRVQIIAISNEKTAKEFRAMAQKKVKQKLVIKQK